MNAPLTLPFTPGDAATFIDRLWRYLPAHPDGAFLGAMHHVGDQGQIVVNLNHPQVKELVVRPGQILLVPEPRDPITWTVVETPDTTHLRLPQ